MPRLRELGDPFAIDEDLVLAAGRLHLINVAPDLQTRSQLIAALRHGLHAQQWKRYALPKPAIVQVMQSNESVGEWESRARVFHLPELFFNYAAHPAMRIHLIRHYLARDICRNGGWPLQAEVYGEFGMERISYDEEHWLPGMLVLDDSLLCLILLQ